MNLNDIETENKNTTCSLQLDPKARFYLHYFTSQPHLNAAFEVLINGLCYNEVAYNRHSVLPIEEYIPAKQYYYMYITECNCIQSLNQYIKHTPLVY